MNKKIVLGISGVAIVALLFFVISFFASGNSTDLTASEREWIEDNRNKLIDLSVINGVSIINQDGTGILFDFLDALEEETGLAFNKVPYSGNNENVNEYAFQKVEEVSENDILFYRDSYALLMNTKFHYTDVTDLKNLMVGTLEDDMTKISSYLTGSTNLTFQTFDDVDTMIEALENNTVNAIALPKLSYLEEVINNENLNIVYDITEYAENYVLTLGDNETLNNILIKYFNKWQEEEYTADVNRYLADSYFSYNDIDERERANFRSKRYTYGFVLNAPFDAMAQDGVAGFNYSFLHDFAEMANIEIDYKRYSSYENLINDFNNNELDIIFDYTGTTDYNIDVFNTVDVYDGAVAILVDADSNITVNNVSSLNGYTILTIADSKIDKYLTDQGIETETFSNISALINNLDRDEVAAIDELTYDYYVRSDLNEFRNVQTIYLDNDYGFVARDISDNETFNNLFDFYLTFVNGDQIINNSYKDLLMYNNSNKTLKLILSSLAFILILLIGIVTFRILKKKKDYNGKLSKTDKLRYVDTLTSLKNRNYLNDNMNKWDNSDVYPQAIVMIDLNNIAYINDNFGHVEGDKVITEAAAILINNQLSNSEIVRTNGNEFLVYLVGHDEKSVVTYIRRLNKEFKDLSHGFGAALGYSMITDEIKTIDDAVNEATIDMRKNKEEVN